MSPLISVIGIMYCEPRSVQAYLIANVMPSYSVQDILTNNVQQSCIYKPSCIMHVSHAAVHAGASNRNNTSM